MDSLKNPTRDGSVTATAQSELWMMPDQQCAAVPLIIGAALYNRWCACGYALTSHMHQQLQRRLCACWCKRHLSSLGATSAGSMLGCILQTPKDVHVCVVVQSATNPSSWPAAAAGFARLSSALRTISSACVLPNGGTLHKPNQPACLYQLAHLPTHSSRSASSWHAMSACPI